MTTISLSLNGETSFQKLLGHNKEVMKKWSELGEVLENTMSLSKDLKEHVRTALAHENGCLYCKAKREPEKNIQDEKTIKALGFVSVFLRVGSAIPQGTFKVLKETFNEKEISELCAFVCFTTASQYFGEMMDLRP
ncbi:carboxymuconolactone decarboxylase family protein [Priestia endophytica]|uniref:Alkylhydroperoxidase n=1 Tax=Priestia endophytica TaxID=135735 RepID=A0AAX1QDK8_9BACI|nr:carboxymuconolactone decarboxylase family protein [Priestia endophytica]RAS81952.1 alkylhydroperoxidase [Priestia endophytica]RAS86478.1 alkylhydroperoxidase [Priestia endophytica]RAS86503.1 alkylhydroperoxidase [Priestia endophytica]